MTNLTNLSPASTFGDLLTLNNNGQGITAGLQQVQDGLGNNTAIQLSTTELAIAGTLTIGTLNVTTLEINGVAITSTAAQINSSTQDNPVFGGTGAMLVPRGTTAQRPGSPVNGDLRYNTTTSGFEVYAGGSWVGLAAGTVTSIGLLAPAIGGITVSGSPITSSGSFQLGLDGNLSALQLFTSTGIATQTGTSTWAARSIAVGSANLTVTNGSGVAGNPTLDLATTLTGLVSVTIGNLVLSGNTIDTTSGVIQLNKNLQHEAGTQSRWYRADNVFYTSVMTSGSQTQTLNYVWPLSAPSAGQGLASDASGNLSWTTFPGTGTVTSVAVTGSTGLTVGGSPITTAGTITLTLGAELQALSALSSTGLVVRTGAAAYTERSIAVGSANLTVSNGSGVGANPTLDLATTIVITEADIGNIEIENNTIRALNAGGGITLAPNGGGTTTLGTVGSGTWNGSTIGIAYGGTAATSFTPYAIICGGTGATTALQSVASVGNAGQVLTSNGAGNLPTFQNNLGVVWTDQTTTPVTVAANTAYIADNAGLVTFNVPALMAQGAEFDIAGFGAGGWLVQFNAGQTGHLNSATTTVAGSLASTNRYDCIKILCVVANTTFVVLSSSGSITNA